MSSSVINSSLPFNHSSSGSSPQFWEALPPCIFHPAGFVFQFFQKIINLIVGYPANMVVLWLVAREKSDSSTSNNFIFSLALADAWCCIRGPVSCLSYLFFYTKSFDDTLNLLDGITSGSPLFLACICLDRYVAVVHPIVFTRVKDKKIRVAISMLAWGLVMLYAVNVTLFTDFHEQIFLVLNMASFTIMCFCNVSIIWSLRKSVLGKEKINPMKKKALRTVQIYLGAILFHYLPGTVFSLMSYNPDFPIYCTFNMIILSHQDCSSSTQPLLYLFLIKQLPLLKKLLCIRCRSPSPEPHKVST